MCTFLHRLTRWRHDAVAYWPSLITNLIRSSTLNHGQRDANYVLGNEQVKRWHDNAPVQYFIHACRWVLEYLLAFRWEVEGYAKCLRCFSCQSHSSGLRCALCGCLRRVNGEPSVNCHTAWLVRFQLWAKSATFRRGFQSFAGDFGVFWYVSRNACCLSLFLKICVPHRSLEAIVIVWYEVFQVCRVVIVDLGLTLSL